MLMTLYRKGKEMSKDKETVRQSDLIEMLDRHKSFTFDLQDFAMRNQAEVTLRISPDGNINFQVVEKTQKHIYWKSLDQQGENFKYQEARNVR